MKSRINLFVALAVSLTSFFDSQLAFADGDILVSVRRGALRITGGRAEGQVLRITATTTRFRYRLETTSGTTLNGAAGPVFVEGITGNTDIRLSADQSIVAISEGIHSAIEFNGNLNISLSSRNSSIVMLDTVLCYENINLTTGGGVDAVLMAGTGSQDATTIRTGSGDDTVLGHESFPSLELLVDGGSGSDILMFEDLSTLGATFRGASGNDLFGWESSVLLPAAFELEFDGAAGKDQYFNGAAIAPTLRRMEGTFAGDYDDMISIASSRDQFYLAALLWVFWGLDG